MHGSVGLRERKKAETRRAIADAALQLALERGPDAITVDDIAAAADVSPRTVFNYFTTKDEAILGIGPERTAELRDAIAARPARETPLQALHAVFAEVLAGAGDAATTWHQRAELVRRHPRLHPAHVAAMEAFEREIVTAVASRTGVDPEVDPYPQLVVAIAIAALRTALAHPSAAGGPGNLVAALDRAFTSIASGLAP